MLDILGAGAGLLGTGASVWSNERNIAAAKEMNEQNIGLQRENRDWSERMANTSHQREVADLKASGLNPVLAAGGGGAGVPASSAAQVEAPKSADMGEVVKRGAEQEAHQSILNSTAKKESANAVSSGAQAAVAAERAKREVKAIGAKTDFTRAQTAIAKSLAPERAEALKSSAEAGGVMKAGRSMWNRLGFSSALEFMQSGELGSKIYDWTHPDSTTGSEATGR